MARILVVDQDPAVAEEVAGSLSAKGHEVSVATSPYGAVAEVRRAAPSVVLLDLGLEVEAAVELGRRLLAIDASPSFVVQTRTIDRAMVEAASTLRAAGIVRRGSSPERLCDVIQRALRLRKNQPEP